MRLDREGAIRRLQSVHPLNLPRRWSPRILLRAALLQIPYRVFEIGTSQGIRHLAFDMFAGTLDPYLIDSATEFEESSGGDRNRLPRRLTDDEIRSSVESRFQRIRFQEGFFRYAGNATAFHPETVDIFVPYWVGIFGPSERPHLRVIDAVRVSEEGSRLRHALISWISDPDTQSTPQDAVARG
jgi:hypothetical protein